MKTGIATALIALCLPVTVFATSLRLPNDIDLLILDGKKVSNSLLHGADGIELENGRHQPAFHIEKTIRLSGHEERLYIPPPLVIGFDTQLVNQVSFHLLHLSNERDATRFDDAPRVELLDGDSMPVLAKLDTPSIMSIAEIVDYEMETERYNKAAKHASSPQFAAIMTDDDSLLSGVSELDRMPPRSQTLIEQRLKCWFQQADAQTRSNFLQ